jgi:membrane associated rhomboid family serine protease
MLHDRDYMRGRQSSNWLQWMWSDAVTLLVVVNVVVFVLQVMVNDGRPFGWGILSMKALAEGRVWTLFTHMFLHEGVFHILGNALMIFFVGKALQSLLGTRNLLYVYFLSGLGGAVMEMAMGMLAGQNHPMVGASACAFGLLMGLAVMLPQEKITAMIYFIIPLRMKLWNMAMLLMGVSVVLALLQLAGVWDTNIAHFAHIGGGLTGWWFVRTLGYGGRPITYERLWHERQQREQSRELAGVRRKTREASSGKSSHELKLLDTPNTKDFIEREIDPILDKITAHGITSLTEEERRLLQQARNEIINRDGR